MGLFGLGSRKQRTKSVVPQHNSTNNELAALPEWIAEAETFEGRPSSCGAVLRPGEREFFYADVAGLLEARSSGGHYQGGSRGVSMPVGRTRVRVGRTHGTYVAGTPQLTLIDKGQWFITNERVVFLGSTQTREVPFAKWLGYDIVKDGGALSMSISGRQEPVVIFFGPSVRPWVRFYLELALAHHRGAVPAYIDELRAGLQA